MKLNQSTVFAAALAGVFAAGTVAAQALPLVNTRTSAEKSSCSGKNGCSGKKKDKDSCSAKKKDKDSCSAKKKDKDSCSGKTLTMASEIL